MTPVKKTPKKRRRRRSLETGQKAKKVKKYVRGSLIALLYQYFDDVGIDNVTFEETKELALSIKPDTKFNKMHLSWYKVDYRNKRDIF